MEENVKIIPGKITSLMQKNDTTNTNRDEKTNELTVKKTTSLTTLIHWNVKKVLDMNPSIDIKSALNKVQRRLETEARDVSFIVPDYPEERHLACALLAWQQLGHRDADSLHQFVQEELNSRETESIRESSKENDQSFDKSFCLESYSGPVVKLPIEPKIVMRLENMSSQCPKFCNKDSKNILSKIEEACCKMDTDCVDQLSGIDDTIKDLRKRAALLARREAERVELLERAEAAWKDLERGYKRRFTLCEEKQEELAKQVQKLIDERNNHKNSCLALTQQLKIKGEVAERDRMRLVEMEKELCGRACTRQKLLQQSAQLDAQLTDHQCKASQLERDLSFKEEQTRRKIVNIESQLDSARALTHEAERAMRAELLGLRDQVNNLSKHLTEEDAENGRINEMLASMREEKMEMIQDLEGCKELCDGRMQSITDELVAKQIKLAELKEKVLECRCKQPRDVSVEVKRTPSLVALCHCTPEQKILDSCSCTSLRGRMLTTLLSDLFSGLQSELGPSGSEMPCQLLKCLEDKHNWDRASIVKTNLKNFFAHLLVGELDIAIANSIERYHAKWIGENCADIISKMTPECDISRNEEGWQQRVIERRAQKLATHLAEQLFQIKAEELNKQAKDFIDSGPPPCECVKDEPQAASTQVPTVLTPPPPCECEKEQTQAASTQMPSKGSSPKPSQSPRDCPRKSCNSCYTCLVTTGPRPASSKQPAPWVKALQDVTQLRLQIEDLKKDSIKKDDLKKMELKIAKIVGRTSLKERNDRNDTEATFDDVMRNLNTNKFLNAALSPTLNKCVSIKNKQIDGYNNIKKGTKVNSRYTSLLDSDKTYKSNKHIIQTYAINTCLCYPKDTNKASQPSTRKAQYLRNQGIRTSSKSRNPKVSKPISDSLLSEDLISVSTNSVRKMSEENSCPTVCFHKIPSTTSIDKLLEALLKWKNDLNKTEENKVKGKSCPCSAHKKNYQKSEYINENRSSINKEGNLNNDLNKFNSVQNSSQHIFKQDKRSEREKYEVLKNTELMEEMNSNVQKLTDISNCKKPTSSKLKTKGESESNAKPFNVKALRSFSKPVRKTLPENKTRSNMNPKVTYDSNKAIFKATTLVNNNAIVDNTLFVIPTTESEYLGAINLEKSNEEISKCNKSQGNHNSIKPIATSFTSPIKCAISNKSSFDVLKNDSPQSEMFEANDGKCMIDFIDKVKYEVKSTDESKSGNESTCSYKIKFLGVTLTDVKPKEQQHLDTLPQYNQSHERIMENYLQDNYENRLYPKETDKNDIIVNQLETVNKTTIRNKFSKNVIRRSETIMQNKNSQSEEKQQEIAKTNASSCESNKKFERFKNCIDIALQHEYCSNDKSLDIQRFIDTEDKKKSRLCCDNDGDEEESRDLEENAFQLLEEHLKQKLENFKQTSCQSDCIPQNEEEKLFSIILTRVKKIISDSANNISCKCFMKDGEGHGSWNRAYALLEEYLRIKIKRVQCICSLADNNETILPDVLNKVCNLIDSDFQRLKDVCECHIEKEPQKTKIPENNSRQEHFENETPEKDTNTDLCIVIDKPCLILKEKQITKENVLLQVSKFLGMDTKSCDPIGFSKIDNSLSSQPLQCPPAYNISHKRAISEILLRQKNVKYSFPYLIADEHKFTTVSDTYTQYFSESKKSKVNNNLNKDDVINLHLPHIRGGIGCTCELGMNFLYDCKKCSAKTHVTDVVNCPKINITENGVDKSLKSKSIIENILEPKKIFVCESCPRQDSIPNKDLTKTHSATLEEEKNILKAPYVGYTIDCSCNLDLGKCVCTKSLFKPSEKIENIWNKSLAQKYNDKLYYIKNMIEQKTNEKSDNLALVNNLIMDSYQISLSHRDDCETSMSNLENGEVILRDSRINFQMTNIKTNTYYDHNRIITDNSMNETSVDWCDYTTDKNEVHSQLKKSIYFSVPVKHSDEKRKIYKNSSKQKPCNCDMVPICHVRLLVENIESNLANSKCTCDSMISKVCPIHSHQ